MNYINTILDGARTAFIDENYISQNDYKPQLVMNTKSHQVLTTIKEELQKCDEFLISVAFITSSGITPLLEDLRELEIKGIKGKIITTDYLNFSEPDALKKLNNFSNIEVKLYSNQNEGFHTKGYIFGKNGIYKAIVGSSNLTQKALNVNKEWNVCFSSLKDGEIIDNILYEFNTLWKKADDLDNVISNYEKVYEEKINFRDFNKKYAEIKEKEDNINLIPNSMQKRFLSNIRELIKNNQTRALLVSATGTGKTYASAFAVKDFEPKKFLFLVHREQIAKQSINTYKKVFKDEDEKFGLLSGNSKDMSKDYLFSTIQTMSKKEIYTSFDRDEFDYIVIDEVHKAGASSYLEVINYFTPKFWLGMSASPDRNDDFNIYELFDYNVALDIRLQDALEQDLLCPFHYFGITDLIINGKICDEETDFLYLTSDDRVNYLLEKSDFYGYSGSRRKALVFCSTKKEAKELSKKFSERGYPSIALTGENTQIEREKAIDKLTCDDCDDYLEFIFTVDIFNEGVDIPEVNQVLLVRPTESSIIFIQQLGRGIRKYKNKEYVVILDFIGNYKNNFLIPMALSGDRSFDKDNIRRYLMEGSKVIPGASSINFDSVSRERIFESINNTSFSRIKLFKEAYTNLKYRLGRIPYLVDFYKNGELNPSLILEHNKFDCYYSFLSSIDDEYTEKLSADEIKSLKFITDMFSNGKRPHELIILKLLIKNKYFTINQVEKCLEKYEIFNDFKSIKGSINIFRLEFFLDKDKKKYDGVKFFEISNDEFNNLENIKDMKFIISETFDKFLNDKTYTKHIYDVIDYALLNYEDKYKQQTENVNLKLYAKYSRKDTCRLLNWNKDESSTMYGYKAKHGTCPIFVTYKKKEDISNSTKYEDEFITRDMFSWMTRSKRTLESKEVKEILESKDLQKHLFIKKHDSEGNEYYYMGQLDVEDKKQTTIKNNENQDLDIVNIIYKLHNPVKLELYNYFTKEINE